MFRKTSAPRREPDITTGAAGHAPADPADTLSLSVEVRDGAADRDRIAALEADLGHAQTRIDMLMSANDRLSGRVRTAEAGRDHYRGKIARLEGEARAGRAALEKARGDAARLESVLDAERDRANGLACDLAKAVLRADDTAATTAHDLSALRERVNGLADDYTTTAQAAEAHLQRAQAAEARVAALEAEVAHGRDLAAEARRAVRVADTLAEMRAADLDVMRRAADRTTLGGRIAQALGLGRRADAAAALAALRTDHAAWAARTFPGVGPVGALRHLALEAEEAAQAPDDLSEWVGVQFLFWDAQRRAGISDAALARAGRAKLAELRGRTYPAPVEGQPCEHVKVSA